jgi:hypothetical protein
MAVFPLTFSKVKCQYMLFLLKSTDFRSSSCSNNQKYIMFECFLQYGIMLTIKCFQFLVLRNKVEKLENRKKEKKTLFATV